VDATNRRRRLAGVPSPARFVPIGLAFACLCLLFPLAAHAYLASFMRLNADDYCYAVETIERGFLGAQLHWYTSWTGVFSFNAGTSALVPWWPGSVAFLPTVALVAWVAAAAWTAYRLIGPLRPGDRQLVSLLIGALVVYATLRNLPVNAQVIQWHSGMVKNLSPVVCLAFGVGLIAHVVDAGLMRRRPRATALVVGALAFVAGGFSETYAALQTATLVGAIALLVAVAGRALDDDLVRVLLAALVGALLAVVVVALAPGNESRATFFPPPPEPLRLLRLSLGYARSELLRLVAASPASVALVLLAPAALALLQRPTDAATLPGRPLGADAAIDPSPRALRRFLLLAPPVALALYAVCFVPAAYATSLRPPERALAVPWFTLVALLAAWSFTAGLLLGRSATPIARAARLLVTAGALVLVAAPLSGALATLAGVPAMRAYAATWDAADARLRAARADGQLRVVAPRVRHPGGLRDLAREPDFWLNVCVARYYGLESVVIQ
jgi:hypothetical protein